MSDIHAGLHALLKGETTVSTIVGNRVYPHGHVPQGTLPPYVVLTQISSEENQTLDGHAGLRFVDVDIDCKADRSVESAELGSAVRRFIDDYTGPAGNETIDAVLMNSESTEFEPPSDGSDVGLYTTLLDVTIQYTPS